MNNIFKKLITLFLLSSVISAQEKAKPLGEEVEKARIRMALISDKENTFLSVEPGCGYYKLSLILSNKKNKLFKIEQRLGAPINEKGKVDVTGNGLVDYYLMVSVLETQPNKLTLLKKIEEE